MNLVVLIGYLGSDPELRYTNTQMPVCTGSVGISRGKKDGRDLGTDWIRITLFGKQAETFHKFHKKGSRVAVEGRLQTGSYKNQNGDTVYTTDVIVHRFDFVTSRSEGQGGGYNQQNGPYSHEGYSQPQRMAVPEGFTELDDDDIPF